MKKFAKVVHEWIYDFEYKMELSALGRMVTRNLLYLGYIFEGGSTLTFNSDCGWAVCPGNILTMNDNNYYVTSVDDSTTLNIVRV